MDSIRENATGIEVFTKDVLEGLTAHPKSIPSKYLYDRKGSMLFEEIMDLPEYYPSRCELEILRSNKSALADLLREEKELYVVDLGAGNGLKSITLLKYLQERTKLSYFPIDISDSALEILSKKAKQELPELHTECIHNDYIHGLQDLTKKFQTRKLVLFLGSSIGNFTLYQAMHFLSELRKSLNDGDFILIGFDLKKNPEIIRRAYFDSKGITAKFNLNILKRINRDLGGEFQEENFQYYPAYNPITGELKSFLISTKDQEVFIKSLDKFIHFKKWETIHTECSNKYDLNTIQNLAAKSGFRIRENFFDSKERFCNSFWRAS